MQVCAKDSSVFTRINALRFSKYIDRQPVGNILSDIGANYISYTWGTVRSTYLRFIYFVYSEDLWIEIKVKDFKYQESYNPQHSWSIEEFKKEKQVPFDLCIKEKL